MFTFALGLFAGHQLFLFIFNLFLLFAEGGRRNLEESVQKEKHWSQLLHVSGVQHVEFPHFPSFAAQFSSFPTENVFQNLEENLWTINWITEFPHFSLTLTISKISPDFLKNSLTFPWPWKNFRFSLALKTFHLSLTFPWPWQPCLQSTLSTAYTFGTGTLVSVCHLRWGRLGERDLPHTKGQLTWKGEDPSHK